jgi:hypothetical protein
MARYTANVTGRAFPDTTSAAGEITGFKITFPIIKNQSTQQAQIKGITRHGQPCHLSIRNTQPSH